MVAFGIQVFATWHADSWYQSPRAAHVKRLSVLATNWFID